MLISSEVPFSPRNGSTFPNVLKEKLENLVSQQRSKSRISNSTFFRLQVLQVLLFVNDQIANTQQIVAGQTGKQIDRRKDIQAESQRERVSE